jgi:signal transduction histidine kinase/ActR/RegA family two-component response regulator
MFHKTLEKQICKLTKAHLEDEQMRKFLKLVSSTYDTFEKDKIISEHAFAISEKEYQEINNHLIIQNDITRQSIKKLKAAITSLDNNVIIQDNDEADLINIISYLEFQITKTKELELLLINSRDQAEKAAGAKSDFLSVMSHEIRTPLNAIIGNIHLLQQEEKLPGQTDYLRVLQISADNLLNLINDILDFGKIEEGKIQFSEKDIDIRNLVNNIKMANRMRASEKGNTIKVMFDEDIPAMVKADDVRLNQVLNNLISNAVKFTRNGNITLEVQLVKDNDYSVDICFAIKDTGIGIPAEKQQLIFERFTQANSEITREFGGSGLGLTIIRRLLNLQGSDIHVKSEEGKGSTFYFTLRFKKSNAEKQVEIVTDRLNMDLQGIKILLVEDVEFNVMVAEKMLTSWNAIVEIAENGLIGVNKARETAYDIILMDLQMPIMDGYTAATTIRSFNTSIPIIALTASASSDIQVKAFEKGMNNYVSKPFNPQDLFGTIYKYTIAKNKTGQTVS